MGEKPLVSGLQLAHHVVSKFGVHIADLSHLKLQKLAYYVKVWSLVAGSPIVGDSFEKWSHGPVSRSLFNQLRGSGKQAIPLSFFDTKVVEPLELDAKSERLIEAIVYTYGLESALALSAHTHGEKPWAKVKENDVISDESLVEYYSKQPFAESIKNLETDGEFVLPLTPNVASMVFDMDGASTLSAMKSPNFSHYRQGVVALLEDRQNRFGELIQKIPW